MDIIRGFATLPKISLPVGGRDDDVFSDRLNYKYTSFVLIISSFIITYKILQNDHIQCWVPAILARYEHYINIYCWISNTYYVTFKEQTTSLTNKHERMVKYYQWVPLILLALAFFFLIPRFLYRFFTKQSGVDMLNMADAAISYQAVEKFEKRRKILIYLTNTIHFYSTCNRAKRVKKGFSNSGIGVGNSGAMISNSSSKPHIYDLVCCHGKLNGAYLTVLYLFTKLTYIANSIAQLFLLNVFLGFKYSNHGFTMLKDVTRNLVGDKPLNINPYKQNSFSSNNDPSMIFDSLNLGDKNLYSESVFAMGLDGSPNPHMSNPTPDSVSSTLMHRYFPRESACDFRIRMNVDSMVHNYTVQCVLPINLFNEQIFTLLWVWLWLVCAVNCYDLIIWILRLLPGSRYNYIRDRIRFKYSENTVKRSLNSFVNEYLSYDGVFLLRILTLNSSDSVTYDIVQQLWNNYTELNKGNKGGSATASARSQSIQQRYSSRNTGQSSSGTGGNDGHNDNIMQYINVENI